MAEPVSPERLAEVKAAYDRSLYESMSIGPNVMTAWSAVPELLAAAQRTLQAEAEVDRLKAENELLRRLHVGAENSINAALDLAARLDPTCGHTRVRAFIADLLRTLTTTPQKVVGE